MQQTSFPSEMKFCYPWRKYQKRVLEELQEHLSDERLHVIAPPGSGKTVLGLEAVRRINRPTLILAPTIIIRDQWADRLKTLFLPNSTNTPHQTIDWISLDIKKPTLFTAATYQALHTAASEKNKNSACQDLSDRLMKAGIRTIVVDEAHHLKREWWKSLTTIIEGMPNTILVALTATPPYDVAYHEWQRYESLCGPVDLEISVPELILEKNLAPHQDYVYFSLPSQEELDPLKHFRKEVTRLMTDLEVELDLPTCVEEHPWMLFPEEHIESIFDNPAYFSSMLIFLKHARRWIGPEALCLLGVNKNEIPELTLKWLEIFLSHVFFHDQSHYSKAQTAVDNIRDRLSRIGAVERKNVNLRYTEAINKATTASQSKLESIAAIAKAEIASLRDDLRMVILADFIRREDMPKFGEDLKPLKRLGVVPIFERLRREFFTDTKLAVLCGALVIIPEDLSLDLEFYTTEAGLDLKQLQLEPLEHDPGYLKVNTRGRVDKKIVSLITTLFMEDKIQILIGTKALLGEGWDAPAINSLILSTYVGSYVLSNQMRGRAIRTQIDNPQKTANIWHLVCVEPHVENRSNDLKKLSHRFKAFVGIRRRKVNSVPNVEFINENAHEAQIESGVERMAIPPPPYNEKQINSLNQMTTALAVDRQGMRQAWRTALAKETGEIKMEELIKSHQTRVPGNLMVKSLSKPLSTLVVLTGIGICASIISQVAEMADFKTFFYILTTALFIPVIFLLPKTLKNSWHLLRFGILEASLDRIGNIILKTLCNFEFIRTPISELKVHVQKENGEWLECYLEGAASAEKNLFLETLQEVLDPIRNPRYLISDKQPHRKNYYAVPILIGKQKKTAAFFFNAWRKQFGPCELIFTRNPEGRKQLLRARAISLNNLFDGKIRRLNRWQ